MNNTACLPPALRAYCHWLVTKPLLPLKTAAAIATLILIDGHHFTSHKSFLTPFYTTATIKANQN